MRKKLLLLPLVAAATLVVVAPAMAFSVTTRGCNSKQWGSGICWDPATHLAPMHSCPDFTDRHMRQPESGSPMFDDSTGYYDGFVKVRSTIPCGVTRQLMVDDVSGGGWFAFPPSSARDPGRVHGWYWWGGYAPAGGLSYPLPRSTNDRFSRGNHIARTNWVVGPTKPAPIYLQGDLVTSDYEQLRDCRGIPRLYSTCTNLTPATYRRVRR